MDNIFKNETTEDLLKMLLSTRFERMNLQGEVDSCTDCIEDIVQELIQREKDNG